MVNQHITEIIVSQISIKVDITYHLGYIPRYFLIEQNIKLDSNATCYVYMNKKLKSESLNIINDI